MKVLARIDGRDDRRGGALMMALVAVIGVSFMAASFLQVSSAVTRRQEAAVKVKEAFYVAEAGLAEAYTGMMIGKTGNVGTALEPAGFGNGLFWVQATELSTGVTELRSTGLVGGARAELSYVVTTGQVGPASLGMFSSNSLNVPRGALIDGYDSSLGTYDDQLVEAPSDPTQIQSVTSPTPTSYYGGLGLVSSNGDITINATTLRPTEVYGILAPGPQGTVTYVGDPTVYGTVEPLAQSVPLPPIAVPTIAAQPGIDHSASTPLVLQGSQLAYEHLNVAGGAQVVIEGPTTLVLGSMSVIEASSLVFDTTNGPVELYVTGDLELATGTTVTTTSVDPSQVTVSVSDASLVQLHATSTFHGFVYAPEGDVDVLRTFELFGGVVANNLILNPRVQLHFDQHLAALANEEAYPLQLSWRLVRLEAGDVGGSGADPLQILGITAGDVQAPADAHADQTLTVTYRDLGGATQSYTGLESAFDWSNVKEVYSISRDSTTVADPTPTSRFTSPLKTFTFSPIG